jgi:uncharacterized membrane protein required for colicin V production
LWVTLLLFYRLYGIDRMAGGLFSGGRGFSIFIFPNRGTTAAVTRTPLSRLFVSTAFSVHGPLLSPEKGIR